MARQGSLCLLTIRSGRCRADRYRACAFTLSMLMVGVLGSTVRAESHPVDATFRLQWPSGPDRLSWVRVEVLPSNQDQSPGTILEVRNRSRSPLSTGAFQLNDDQSVITFRPREAVNDGCFDFRVAAPANAKLHIQVVDRSKFERSSDCFEPKPGNRAIILPVTNLLGGEVYDSVTNKEGRSDSQWTIQRIEDDQVRIELDRSDALYDEDSPDKMSVRIRATSVPEFAGQSSQFSATIYRVADDEVVARETWTTSLDRNGNADEIIWQQDVPATPGVYEIRCELKPVGSRI